MYAAKKVEGRLVDIGMITSDGGLGKMVEDQIKEVGTELVSKSEKKMEKKVKKSLEKKQAQLMTRLDTFEAANNAVLNKILKKLDKGEDDSPKPDANDPKKMELDGATANDKPMRKQKRVPRKAEVEDAMDRLSRAGSGSENNARKKTRGANGDAVKGGVNGLNGLGQPTNLGAPPAKFSNLMAAANENSQSSNDNGSNVVVNKPVQFGKSDVPEQNIKDNTEPKPKVPAASSSSADSKVGTATTSTAKDEGQQASRVSKPGRSQEEAREGREKEKRSNSGRSEERKKKVVVDKKVVVEKKETVVKKKEKKKSKSPSISDLTSNSGKSESGSAFSSSFSECEESPRGKMLGEGETKEAPRSCESSSDESAKSQSEGEADDSEI